MSASQSKPFLLWILLGLFLSPTNASLHRDLIDGPKPDITFIEFQSYDIGQEPPVPLTVKGKLKLPVVDGPGNRKRTPEHSLPAILILHGSGGVDSRGDFYARALNATGIATLEIDMWEARGLSGGSDRPPLPIYTYPDAFAALAYLANREEIDAERIGILGFSWGGFVSMAAAEELYANTFGGELRFAAHVAQYPVCYGFNNTDIALLLPWDEKGTQFLNLTGAPVLVQVGSEDDYDNGADNCWSLITELPDSEDRRAVQLGVYQGAYHAWDRLQIPLTVNDPFGDEGSFFSTGVVPQVDIIPNVEQAYRSRKRVVEFFLQNL
jgi:dienelactone hydrolase